MLAGTGAAALDLPRCSLEGLRTVHTQVGGRNDYSPALAEMPRLDRIVVDLRGSHPVLFLISV